RGRKLPRRMTNERDRGNLRPSRQGRPDARGGNPARRARGPRRRCTRGLPVPPPGKAAGTVTGLRPGRPSENHYFVIDWLLSVKVRLVINTKPQTYADGDTELAGEFFADASGPSGRRPGVLLVHGGAGLDDHARQQARRYAELGYVVLACDMFGRDIAGGPREQVIALLTGMRDDPHRLVRRARAGLDLLSRVQAIDERMAVVGFCFGGLAALQLARSGAPVAAAVSIHGSLAT